LTANQKQLILAVVIIKSKPLHHYLPQFIIPLREQGRERLVLVALMQLNNQGRIMVAIGWVSLQIALERLLWI
jgi:hypothetical protein